MTTGAPVTTDRLWSRPRRPQPIRTGADYFESLRGRGLRVFLMGERVAEPVDHPVIRPSINAVARTYDLAVEDPELATAHSSLTGTRVNRFLHVTESADDVVMQNRCSGGWASSPAPASSAASGMDAFNALYSVTFEMRPEAPDAVPRAAPRVPALLPGGEPGGGRRHDRPQGRPRARGPSRAGRPRHVRARRGAPAGRHRDPRRQGAPDRLHQLALDRRHADDAPHRGGPRLRRGGGDPGRSSRPHLHLRAPVAATRAPWRAARSTRATRSSPARRR